MDLRLGSIGDLLVHTGVRGDYGVVDGMWMVITYWLRFDAVPLLSAVAPGKH